MLQIYHVHTHRTARFAIYLGLKDSVENQCSELRDRRSPRDKKQRDRISVPAVGRFASRLRVRVGAATMTTPERSLINYAKLTKADFLHASRRLPDSRRPRTSIHHATALAASRDSSKIRSKSLGGRTTKYDYEIGSSADKLFEWSGSGGLTMVVGRTGGQTVRRSEMDPFTLTGAAAPAPVAYRPRSRTGATPPGGRYSPGKYVIRYQLA
ncbi:hypothetical protein EVAR_19444_1 [Eumeta japonica]|uniref:Uncharacterized protein n=1 Tax=Eumeta variegata TaxID=151549 RepID=A0A4C1TRN9_EUMVA|nr:hypothetical protein EVAR_19444_1 [Eumeta japonica]